MIYEETYNYLMKNVSSKEFDVCLYALLKMDWEGNVHFNDQEFAKNVGSKRRYMKDVLNKFVSKIRGRHIFTPVTNTHGHVYRMNIAKSSLLYDERSDKYCKKYNFFYEKEFQSLTINPKRIVLSAAFRMSTTKSEQVIISPSKFVPSRKNEVSLPFTTKRFEEAIEELQDEKNGFTKYLHIEGQVNPHTGEKQYLFTFRKGTLNEFKSNNTEQELIRKKLFESGYLRELSTETCIEIASTGSYLYESLLKMDKARRKEGVAVGAADELITLATSIFYEALEKLAPHMNDPKLKLDTPKKVSAYLSSIINGLVQGEAIRYAHQKHSIDELISHARFTERDRVTKERMAKEEAQREIEQILEYRNKAISEGKKVNEQLMNLHIKLLKYDADMVINPDVLERIKPLENKKNYMERIVAILRDWSEKWYQARVKTVETEASKLQQEDGKEEKGTNKRWNTVDEAIQYAEGLKQEAYRNMDKYKTLIDSFGNRAVDEENRYSFIKEFKTSFTEYFATKIDKLKTKTV